MKTIITSVSLVVAMIGSGVGQEVPANAPETTPEMAAVAANDRAYEAAYAKADIKALVNFYTDDIVYTDEEGTVRTGRAAIEAGFKAGFASDQGSKLAIHLDSVRVLTPDVVVENGSTTVTTKDGDASSALFTAIHVKKDGKWKISQLVETPAPEASPSDHLAELGWLIGDWKENDKEEGVSVQSHYQWARGGNFITRTVTVKRGDDPVLEGWQIIGWNPLDDNIRSWTFDGEGGYSEGIWTGDGKRWLIRETGYAADGSRSSGDQTITRASDDKLYWQSDNRTLDGDPQPSIARIEISKVKGE